MDQAAELLATVVGQDLDQDDADGVFRIVRRVAKDRVISTVDPEARHGHKTSASGFDGYKGHLAIDPDTEIITATEVTAGNTGDAAQRSTCSPTCSTDADDARAEPAADVDDCRADAPDGRRQAHRRRAAHGLRRCRLRQRRPAGGARRSGVEAKFKVQPPVNSGGRFTKDAFDIDLQAAR